MISFLRRENFSTAAWNPRQPIECVLCRPNRVFDAIDHIWSTPSLRRRRRRGGLSMRPVSASYRIVSKVQNRCLLRTCSVRVVRGYSVCSAFSDRVWWEWSPRDARLDASFITRRTRKVTYLDLAGEHFPHEMWGVRSIVSFDRLVLVIARSSRHTPFDPSLDQASLRWTRRMISLRALQKEQKSRLFPNLLSAWK